MTHPKETKHAEVAPAATATQSLTDWLKREVNFCLGEYMLAQNKRMRCQPWKDLADRMEKRIKELEKQCS